MKKYTDTVTLVDESGIEILVTYTLTRCPDQIEEGHGYHNVGGGYEVDLVYVEVVIAGTGLNILKALNTKQIQSLEAEVLDRAA